MTTQNTTARAVHFVACYALWIVLCIFAGWVIFTIHTAILVISMGLGTNQWVAQGFRQLSLPILGIAWLIGIFWLEHYLRKATTLNRLLIRASYFFGALAAVVLLFYLFRMLLAV